MKGRSTPGPGAGGRQARGRFSTAAKKVALPNAPSVLQKSKLKLIDAGDDAKFDERYVKSFGVSAHEDTIKLFEEAARETKDPEVKAFVQKALPSLQHHLDMARALAAK